MGHLVTQNMTSFHKCGKAWAIEIWMPIILTKQFVLQKTLTFTMSRWHENVKSADCQKEIITTRHVRIRVVQSSGAASSDISIDFCLLLVD